MNFDLDRLCRLAGVDGGNGSGMLTETQNRRSRDDHGDKDEYGNQLAEEDAGAEEGGGDPELIAIVDRLVPPGGGTEEGVHVDEMGGMEEEDPVLEIDDDMLREEVRKMRAARMQETKLRAAIQSEIQNVVEEMKADGSWVYGKNKPRNSRDGQVTRGFFGIGF